LCSGMFLLLSAAAPGDAKIAGRGARSANQD
jgi:hypothetical protein